MAGSRNQAAPRYVRSATRTVRAQPDGRGHRRAGLSIPGEFWLMGVWLGLGAVLVIAWHDHRGAVEQAHLFSTRIVAVASDQQLKAPATPVSSGVLVAAQRMADDATGLVTHLETRLDRAMRTPPPELPRVAAERRYRETGKWQDRLNKPAAAQGGSDGQAGNGFALAALGFDRSTGSAASGGGQSALPVSPCERAELSAFGDEPVWFTRGSAELTAFERGKVTVLAGRLHSCKPVIIEVTGYASGSETPIPHTLSWARAEYVARMLRTADPAAVTVITRGLGSMRSPVDLAIQAAQQAPELRQRVALRVLLAPDRKAATEQRQPLAQ
ncbi:MAG: hypothetical protein AAGF32_09335 [Pseudomonadota bacterium]